MVCRCDAVLTPANAQIPMVNVFDDHDIIDGFGSYPDKFMRCAVFSNLGKTAFKYYVLFQHQSSVAETLALESWDKSIILGFKPGPYMNELSRNFLCYLGKDILFLGNIWLFSLNIVVLDCRTERTHDRVVYDETYQKIFARVNQEMTKGAPKHFIIMLGVPIAYPRLVWLETILTSRIMVPIKLLASMGMFEGLVNKFDRGIEILDDLDDHWYVAGGIF